jgi:hypothetical protein
MSRATDLASLFAATSSAHGGLGAAQPVSFLAGTVLFWDPTTGANAIDAAGTVLSNVPVLNRSEIPAIVAGDTVALLIVGGNSKTVGVLGGIIEN